MRRKAAVDNNQKDVVKRLRRAGVGVIVTSMLSGKYTFDLICAFRGVVYLVELKDTDDLPKYFFDLSHNDQSEWLMENRATGNEHNTNDLLMAHDNKLIITYSADHCLRELGAFTSKFKTNQQ